MHYPALRHRNFVLLWSGLLVSNMGTWMQNVAQSWLIYKLTGNNPLYLGLLGLSFAVPMIVVPPLGGVLADRTNRIKLLFVTQTGALVLAALLAVLTWLDLVQPWVILLTSFMGALLLAFDNPTRQALFPDLVPRDALLNALSLNAATFTGAALVGPAIAGALLDIVGAGWLFAGNAASYLAVIGALALLRNVPKRQPTETALRDALGSGFVYAARHKLIGALLVLAALAALFGRSYQQLLPVFADDVWRVGSRGYGALLAAGGAGALIGAFGLSSAPQIERQGRMIVVSGFAFCTALTAFAWSGSFWIGVALLVVVGIAATVFTTMIATMIQLRVPNELRGRVMSLYTVTLIGLPALGALGVAALAQALGTASTGAPRAITSGTTVLAVVILLSMPVLLRLRPPAAVPGPQQERSRTTPAA
jgi:MFS family permease